MRPFLDVGPVGLGDQRPAVVRPVVEFFKRMAETFCCGAREACADQAEGACACSGWGLGVAVEGGFKMFIVMVVWLGWNGVDDGWVGVCFV